MKRINYLLPLLAFSHITFADSLSFDFVQLGYLDNQMSGLEDFEQTGPEIQFSSTVFDHFFVKGRYRELNDSITGSNGLEHTLEERHWQCDVGYISFGAQYTKYSDFESCNIKMNSIAFITV
jgi:hypothetical protein